MRYAMQLISIASMIAAKRKVSNLQRHFSAIYERIQKLDVAALRLSKHFLIFFRQTKLN